MTTMVMVISLVLAFALAIGLFFYMPTQLFKWISDGVSWIDGNNRFVQSTFESLMRVILLVGYMSLMLLMKDIRRTFRFHGAEHKTIFCYEKGLPLTVENVRTQRRFHPRCGTSFMILMILVSIIFSTIVQIIFPGVYNIYWLWVAIKILLIPLVCGAGFEVLKICGRYDNLFTKIISAPGLWLQRLTTKEPDDGMIEIAIAALKACEPAVPDVDRSVDRTEETDETEE